MPWPPLSIAPDIFSNLSGFFFFRKTKSKNLAFLGVKNDFDPISASDSMDDKPARKI